MGTKTLLTDAYGMKHDEKFVNSLEENIRKRGAMNKLSFDSEQHDVSTRVKYLLGALCIDDWQS